MSRGGCISVGMGRYLRHFTLEAIYHCWFKVLNSEFRLMHDEDIKVLEAYLVHYKKVWKVRVLCYSIMSNHVHLMLENAAKDLWAISCFLRDVKREFSKYYNISHGRAGACWSYGYGCKEIRDEVQYFMNIAYILMNAVKARICSRADEHAHSAFPLVMTEEDMEHFKREGRFMSEEEAELIIAQSKRVGYAGRLPEEARVARGLGWELSDKRLMPLVHQGRREYKRRGPMPYWHPEDTNRTVHTVSRFLALAVLDVSPKFGPIDPETLRRYCDRSATMTEESWERVDGMRIIFEAGSKKECRQYQSEKLESLPPNAQLPGSVIATGRGTWALVAIQGRPRRRE